MTIRIEELKKFLSEDPSDCFSAYALALEFMKINKTDDAISLLQQVLLIDKNYLAAYYQIGKLYEFKKDYAAASSAYKNGMEIAEKKNDRKTFNELQSAFESIDDN